MRLGLRMGLNSRGAGGGGDIPSLDLQFATDKTLTARKGPTPVFTRASGATQVGASGLIEFAPENLVLQSQNQAAANWSLLNSATKSANSSIGVDGTTSATTVTFSASNASLMFSSVTLPSVENSPTTLSVWVSSPTLKKFRLAIFGASQVYSADITPTSSLARYQLTVPNINTASPSVVITNEAAGGVGSIIVWGFQFERSSTARAYIPTTTAAVYGARFDHDPISLACRGLLIEESRTNLALQSENHPSATWSKTGVTVASATNTAPNGSTTSNLVSEDSSTGLHRIFQSTAYVTGTSYSISCFLKYAGRQFVAISHPVVALNNIAIFDIQNGTISLSQSGITSSITAYPNGWYRCVINGLSSMTSTQSHIIQGSTTGGTLTGSYTGLNGAAFYIYGSQVEAGAFPTSYIPTTTASVVRSADVCSISGASFTSFYNNAAGTFITEAMITNLVGDNRAIAQIDSGTSDNIIRHSYTASVGGFNTLLRANLDTLTTLSVVTGTASTIQKRATAYEGTSFASVTNGGTVATATRTFPVGLNTLRIGSLSAGGFVLSGHIAAVRFYKKRLPNAKLQTLTA